MVSYDSRLEKFGLRRWEGIVAATDASGMTEFLDHLELESTFLQLLEPMFVYYGLIRKPAGPKPVHHYSMPFLLS